MTRAILTAAFAAGLWLACAPPAILGGPEPLEPCPGRPEPCPRGYRCTSYATCEAPETPPTEWARRADAGPPR